jgi:hypothetical protein
MGPQPKKAKQLRGKVGAGQAGNAVQASRPGGLVYLDGA